MITPASAPALPHSTRCPSPSKPSRHPGKSEKASLFDLLVFHTPAISLHSRRSPLSSPFLLILLHTLTNKLLWYHSYPLSLTPSFPHLLIPPPLCCLAPEKLHSCRANMVFEPPPSPSILLLHRPSLVKLAAHCNCCKRQFYPDPVIGF